MKYETMDAKALVGEAVYEMACENPNVVIVSTDSAPRTGLTKAIAEFPERYFELGIMEQSAEAVAAGLATQGKVPVFCSPAPFATARAFEFFKIDIGYMRQNVKVIGRNCGFNYSDLGPTHYGLDDMALVRIIPNITILAPMDAGQLKGATKAMLKAEGPCYLRFRTAKISKIFDEEEFVIGKGQKIRDGKEVAIIVTGEMCESVLEAVEKLTADGFDPMVIGMPTVNPLDKDLVLEAARTCGRIVTVEEGFITGGLGTAVMEAISEEAPVPVKRLGAPMEYIPAGQFNDEIHYCGLDVEGIYNSVVDFVKRS